MSIRNSDSEWYQKHNFMTTYKHNSLYFVQLNHLCEFIHSACWIRNAMCIAYKYLTCRLASSVALLKLPYLASRGACANTSSEHFRFITHIICIYGRPEKSKNIVKSAILKISDIAWACKDYDANVYILTMELCRSNRWTHIDEIDFSGRIWRCCRKNHLSSIQHNCFQSRFALEKRLELGQGGK